MCVNAKPLFGRPKMNTSPDGNTKIVNYEYTLEDIAEIIFKKKGLIIGGSLIVTFLVGLITFLSPREYQSEALILVSPSILKPGTDGNKEAQMSQITVSSLDASTYKVLAKSDELLVALSDTLKAQLDSELLTAVFPTTNSYELAKILANQLEVDLLQESNASNTSTQPTPLLVFRHRSIEEKLPTQVVNTWSELFLKRNQGLSSNVTDEFYQNVMQQYEQVKENLEKKEGELAKFKVSSSELKRTKIEMSVKAVKVDSFLSIYEAAKVELNAKQRTLKYNLSALKDIEIKDQWVGDIRNFKVQEQSPISVKNIIALIEDIRNLEQDSTIVSESYLTDKSALNTIHSKKRAAFERQTNFTFLEKQLKENNVSLEKQTNVFIKSSSIIDSLKLQSQSLQHALQKEEKVRTTRKAIVDDALWKRTITDGKISAKEQQDLGRYKLISEEINPIYSELSKSLAMKNQEVFFNEKRLDYFHKSMDSLILKSAELRNQLTPIYKEKSKLERELASENTALKQEFLERMSSINFQLLLKRQLYDEYRLEYSSLRTETVKIKHELQKLEKKIGFYRENYDIWRRDLSNLSTYLDSLALENRRIEREVSVYQESFNRFAKLQEEARIARQQAAGDIQVVSKAQIAEAIKNNLARNILITGILSFCAISVGCIFHNSKKKK